MVTAKIPERQLPSGAEMPMLGLGTYDLHGDDLRSSIRTAFDIGYRHIDTSEGYENESAIGESIQDLPREELFLTSKVIPPNLTYDNLVSSCEDSLDRLDTDYLDLYLIHWPNPAVSMRETFDAMETLVDRGLVRDVGVSNFTEYQLRYARHISPVQIAVNQIEINPWWRDETAFQYCQEANIAVTAAAPFGQGAVLADDVITNLADKYNRTPAQVILQWQIQKGIATIPKSTSAEHLRSNAAIFDWELDSADIECIDNIDLRERTYLIKPDHEKYGIHQ